MLRLGSLLPLAAAAAVGAGVSGAPEPRGAPPPERSSERAPERVPPNADPSRACPVPARFRRAFAAAAADARLPVSLLAAMSYVESRFQPEAESPQGAVGLMQVLPTTGRELGLDVSDPSANVLAGARFMRAMLDRFGSADAALAAYNAGPAAVERAAAAPSLETLRYVIDVNARWRAHLGCVA